MPAFKNNFLFILLAAFFLASCSPTKHLKEDELLVNKVKMKVDNYEIDQEKLYAFVKQKPNRKLLGVFRPYLWIYNLTYKKKESKIRNKIGEPPVIYDSTLSRKSVDQLRLYLNNRGYYDNEVKVTKKLVGKKKINLKFEIDKQEQYSIASIDYEIKDKGVERYFKQDSSSSLIKKGEAFDTEILQFERDRITKLLKNKGYFFFSKEFVYFKADSSQKSKSAKLTLGIENDKVKSGDSTIKRLHRRYTINEVYVRLDFESQRFYQEAGDTIIYDDIHFVYKGAPRFHPADIACALFLRPGDLYQLKNQELSYRNLSALRVFQYISIRFEKDPYHPNDQINCYVEVAPRKHKAFTIESEGTNSGGNLGISGNLSFQNNNTFKGAETLRLRLKGGLEVQQALGDEEDDAAVIEGFLPFNTFEFGPEISYEVPRFLLPGKKACRSPKGNPRTTFNASYNYQERPDYRRNVSKAFIAYSWQESAKKTHIIQPFDISLIKLEPSDAFIEALSQIENPFILNSYQDHFIMALKYSYIYNGQSTNRLKDFIYFRGNAELAGSMLTLFNQASGQRVNAEGFYNIFGIRYAEYVRTDVDFRFYQNFPYSSMVYRFAGGIGLPYSNAIVMPFEKSFFAGGANGIRAWNARQLGPGSLPDAAENGIDQIGNMTLETNIEYRFDVTNVVEGAAFTDMGNIWEVYENSQEETRFATNKLWNDLAIGVGLGLRLDFSFFIIRFDVAAPLKDPSSADPQAIDLKIDQSNLNIGIGYPF